MDAVKGPPFLRGGQVMHEIGRTSTISASHVLALLRRRTVHQGPVLIDVRSEGEYVKASIPGFTNAPILNNDERHAVGLRYKQDGQKAAIALGERLVVPHKGARLAYWQQLQMAGHGPALIACWRGGLRSEIACAWLREAGIAACKIVGGYKALRLRLMRDLEHPPQLWVLAGLTGSAKTRLLAELEGVPKVDLEGLACHRGSSFGAFFAAAQPTQPTFENALALALHPASEPIIIEDESAAIGRLRLPKALHRSMMQAQMIWLEAGMAERVQHIHAEYVTTPLTDGIEPVRLGAALVESTRRLRRRLGGALAARIAAEIGSAFADGDYSLERHQSWIRTLLEDYYDRSYLYGLRRLARREIFRGDYAECRQWIMSRYA